MTFQVGDYVTRKSDECEDDLDWEEGGGSPKNGTFLITRITGCEYLILDGVVDGWPSSGFDPVLTNVQNLGEFL